MRSAAKCVVRLRATDCVSQYHTYVRGSQWLCWQIDAKSSALDAAAEQAGKEAAEHSQSLLDAVDAMVRTTALLINSVPSIGT